MKTTKSFHAHSPLAAAFSAALLANFAAPSALAATSTWNGGYGTTASWNNAANWGGTAFSNTNDVVFNNVAGTSPVGTFIASGKTVKSITFNGGTPSPAFNIRLATSSGGGAAASLTFIPTNTGITVASTDTAAHNIGQSDGNIILQDNLPITHNGSSGLTISRPITDGATPYGVTKSGTGTLILSAANTYDGQTTISGGILRGVVGGSCATSSMVIDNASASLGVSITDNTKIWTCASLAPTAAGKLQFKFDAVTPSTTLSPLTVTGLADFSTATPTVEVVVTTGLAVGTYPLMTWGSTSGTAPSALTVSTTAVGTATSLQVVGNTLNLVVTATDPNVVKADNSSDLNLGASWVGDVAPAANDLAVWNDTVTAANTTTLGADVSWAGIVIANPAGAVTIEGTNTLTLGAAATDLNLGAATQDLTLNCPLAMSAANSWDVAASRTLTLGGKVSGAFAVTKLGAGTAILSSNANDYTGATTITAGTLKLGASDVIPHGAGKGGLSVAGTLDLNGNSDTVNGLSGAGTIDNLAATTTSTLTVGGNNSDGTFSGVLQNTGGTVNLFKQGTGTLTLSGANTFTGATNVTGGTLIVTNGSTLTGTSGISLAGGTTLQVTENGPAATPTNITRPIALGAVNTTSTITAPSLPADNVGAGTRRAVTYSGKISGAGNLKLMGINIYNQSSTIYLQAQNDYTGSTLITTNDTNANIFVRLNTENALPGTTVLTLDGGNGIGTAPGRYCEFDLNGRSQTLAGLTNVGGLTLRVQRVNNTNTTITTTPTLTVNNVANYAYSGQIGAGGTNLALTKSGIGTFTLAGTNTYTGATTINGGTLSLGAADALPNASAVSIGAATLNAATAGTETAGTLDVTAAATIDLGTGAALAFADSSAVDWTDGTLNITGTLGATSLRFGTTSGGLTSGQLAVISVNGSGTYTLDASGYLVASSGGYASWKATNAPTGTPSDDYDGDGVSNGAEYVLGGTGVSNDSSKLPAVSTSAGNMLFTFIRDQASIDGTTQVVIETGTTLAAWPNTYTVGADNTTSTAGVTVTKDSPSAGKDTVTLTVPMTGIDKRFARLKVTP